MQLIYLKDNNTKTNSEIVHLESDFIRIKVLGYQPFLGMKLKEISIHSDQDKLEAGTGEIVEVLTVPNEESEHSYYISKIALESPIKAEVLSKLKTRLAPFTAIGPVEDLMPLGQTDTIQILVEQSKFKSPDFMARCEHLVNAINDQALGNKDLSGIYWFPNISTALKNRIQVYDPVRKCRKEMISFLANSYYGLENDPRVKEATKNAIDKYGVTTASAAILGGTSSELKALEEKVADFYGRESAIVFLSGYQANLGTISCLLRKTDAVLIDRYAHASIYDGSRFAEKEALLTFQHNDMNDLRQQLQQLSLNPKIEGKLVITDSVFSMHADLAPLPDLVSLCKEFGAYLMCDEAHSNGLIGESGRGIEEYYNMRGSIPILMGTFSKWTGLMGGFIVGKSALIEYIRMIARSNLFSRVMPASFCVAISTAMDILEQEPERRTRLYTKLDRFRNALRSAGIYLLGSDKTAIISVFVGNEKMLWRVATELYYAGVKCGFVTYPAIAYREAILRFVVTDIHENEDIDYASEAIKKIFSKYGMLNRTADELREMEPSL